MCLDEKSSSCRTTFGSQKVGAIALMIWIEVMDLILQPGSFLGLKAVPLQVRPAKKGRRKDRFFRFTTADTMLAQAEHDSRLL